MNHVFFFFQAEDGIRDIGVTGVQTCALPIFRASWGRNGNCSIANFQYLATINVGGAPYFFGPDKSSKTIGSYPDILANEDITWETSEQFDLRSEEHTSELQSRQYLVCRLLLETKPITTSSSTQPI